MSVNAAGLAVRKSVVVGAPIERAWEVFTERIAAWWPLDTHSIGKERIETVVVEGRDGGRIYERRNGGDEESWATVLAWEPPRRLVFTWQITEPATEVEVRFTPEGDGTRVDLEHRGWERLGAGAERRRGSYNKGWEHVLGRYQQAASA
jgi:uncharacterized protein YndB with AHSA1/START domain